MITKDDIKLHLSQKYPGICLKWNEVQNFTDEQVVEEILDYANTLNKSSIIDGIIESPEIQKANLYAIMSIYLNASEEVNNGIYDPIQEALTEIQSKYVIIQKDSL